MEKRGLRISLFLVDIIVTAIGIVITFFLKDTLTMANAVAIILSFITVLFVVNRFMIVEIGLQQLKEDLKDEIIKSNSASFKNIHNAINVIEYFKKPYELLCVSRFDQKIMEALLGKISGDRFIVSETQFYELVNDVLMPFALEEASQIKKKPITDVEIMAVSFNDGEWKTTPEEDKFTARSLEIVKAGIRFRRLFILNKDEIDNMIMNKEYAGVITAHCRHNNGHSSFIEAKIIREDAEGLLNTLKIHIERFGIGFFCIKIGDVFFLIYDIIGDETRGHIFIDQEKSKEIIDDFNHVWENHLATDFTNEIHNTKGTQVQTICYNNCSTNGKCDISKKGGNK